MRNDYKIVCHPNFGIIYASFLELIDAKNMTQALKVIQNSTG